MTSPDPGEVLSALEVFSEFDNSLPMRREVDVAGQEIEGPARRRSGTR